MARLGQRWSVSLPALEAARAVMAVLSAAVMGAALSPVLSTCLGQADGAAAWLSRPR